MDIEAEGEVHQIWSSMWAHNFWITSHSKKHLEQMLKWVDQKVVANAL